MKRLLALGAVSLMFAGSAFAAPCHLEPTWSYVPDCDRITYVEYQALPMTCCEPIVEPDPCCCKKKDPCACQNRSFMGKIFDGTRNVYDATLGNVFGALSGR